MTVGQKDSSRRDISLRGETYNKLKHAAAQRGLSTSELARIFIQEYAPFTDRMPHEALPQHPIDPVDPPDREIKRTVPIFQPAAQTVSLKKPSPTGGGYTEF